MLVCTAAWQSVGLTDGSSVPSGNVLSSGSHIPLSLGTISITKNLDQYGQRSMYL